MSTSVIPLNVFQRFRNYALVLHNPEFSFHYYDRYSARQFIQKKFPTAIGELFESLSNNESFILWILCALYVYGGIYLDNNCSFSEKLYTLTYKEHFAKLSPHKIDGSILACLPKNKIIHRAIYSFESGGSISCKSSI